MIQMKKKLLHISAIIDSDRGLHQLQNVSPHNSIFMPPNLRACLHDITLHGGTLTLTFRTHTAATLAQQQHASLLTRAKQAFGDDSILKLSIKNMS